jgi:Cu(I)/Ag(I) efflux system membrane fusion protein
LSEQDIEGLIVKGRPTGIATITTPMTGVVLQQNAFRGTFVNTGDVVFTIANPRVLWARLDAYASDFPWIRLGQEAVFETDAYPGKTFTGKVLFVDPEFDIDRRVFKVGVLYNDEKGLLKPNMLVRCAIHAKLSTGGRGTAELATQGMMETAQTKRSGEAPLVIPETAPLITGNRAVVYVQAPDESGTYVAREVVLGPRADGYYLVNEGLQQGEMVVVNGNFKIDSAVQILAKSSMMTHPGSPLPVEHYDHVQTPPVPEEMQGTLSEKGAKYKIYSDRQLQTDQPEQMEHSHDSLEEEE